MKRIPFKAVGREYKFLKSELLKEIDKVMRSEELIDENIDFRYPLSMESFETKFAAYCGRRYALGTNSCTSALFLSLTALGIGEGDEVIVPVNTYIASALAVVYAGAKPVFVDITEDSYNINPQEIEEAISQRTKAIMPVHLYGLPADIDPISKMARDYNLKVIEDCAQAHGAEYKEKKVGSFGDFGCFSFYANKNLGVGGDAGILVFDNKEHLEVISNMREYRGKNSGRELLKNVRFPTRLSALNSAILEVKLKYLDSFNKKRQEVAKKYNELLSGTPLILPRENGESSHVYFAYTVRSEKRDQLKKFLLRYGIPCVIEYEVPLHMQSTFSYLGYKYGDFPVAERMSKEILSLPINPFLRDDEIGNIANAIKYFFDKF
jgi:dTDP-4-amino-4,6-dideoxygalactose transaminase